MKLLDKLDVILFDLKSVKAELGDSWETFKRRVDSAHDELKNGNLEESEKILNSLFTEFESLQKRVNHASAGTTLDTNSRAATAPINQIEARQQEIYVRQRQSGKSEFESVFIAVVVTLKEQMEEP
ncbi:MAG: hypothetical protein ACE5HS_05705 [bacterium]